MQIDTYDKTDSVEADYINLVEELLTIAAEQEKIQENAEVSISFVDNDEIQEINKTYRDKDQPTDVISFALEDEFEGEVEIIGVELPRVLGDIIISVDMAKVQAEEYNHSFKRELGFLAVHGFLHLLGYDHMNEADEAKMKQRQEEVLGAYGLER